MFDSIVVYRNSRMGALIDTGLLAEALLFYGNVHLLLNRGTLASLLTQLGPDVFTQLLDRPEIRASYMTQNYGTLGTTVGGLRHYNFAFFELGRRPNKREDLEQVIERTLGASKTSRALVKRLLSKMSFPRIEDDAPGNDVTESARADLDDQAFVREAISRSLADLVPKYSLPRGWRYGALRLNDGSFAIDTNLDFASLNAEYHKIVPETHSSITPEHLLNFIFDANVGTFLASKYAAEFVHDPLCSSLIKLKYVNLLRRRERSLTEIDLFQDLHLEARTIGDVLRSKERSFQDFLKLLDDAQKFKEWLRKANPDEKLASEYFDAVTRDTWVDKLPTKSVRWVITTGLAAAVEAFYPTGTAMAAAQGLSLADATVLDRILKGWKPDQFVEGPLSEFLGVQRID